MNRPCNTLAVGLVAAAMWFVPDATLAQNGAGGPQPWLHPQCNSSADDYSPFPDVDGHSLLLTTERDGLARVVRCSADGGIQPVDGTFNVLGQSRGYVSLSVRGDGYGVMYRSGKRQSLATIVRVSRTASGIEIGEPLSEIIDESYSAQPAIAPDGSRLLFVSDRQGGVGGLDIWMLERRVDGTWSAPQHAGEALNSPADEVSPCLVSADTLLFASNGMGGQGGFDIYMSVYRNGRWSDPEPLDPMNSPNDETDAVRLTNGTYCFCSNRPGGRGGLDLWLWKPEETP